MTVDYSTMSGPEMVAAYNAMCALPIVAANLEERRRKPVQKFADNKTGIARCEFLASQIRAWSTKEEKPAKRERKAPAIQRQPATRRSLVVALLEKHLGSWVTCDELLLAAYGKVDKELRGGLANILRGVKNDIKGADYELSSEKGKRFGLFSKITT